MPQTGIIRRSNIRSGGTTRDVKLISKRDGNGGYRYDVMIDNTVEYKNIGRKTDAKQLYRQAKKQAKEQVKGGNGGGGGPSLPFGGGGGAPQMPDFTGGPGGMPMIPGMGTRDDDDDDDDRGFTFPWM